MQIMDYCVKKPYLIIFILIHCIMSQAQRQMEFLDRGLVAVRYSADSVFISWRLLGTESQDLSFNIYKRTGTGNALKLNRTVLTKGTNYLDSKSDHSQPISYYVKAISKGKEMEQSKTLCCLLMLLYGNISPLFLEIQMDIRQMMHLRRIWMAMVNMKLFYIKQEEVGIILRMV